MAIMTRPKLIEIIKEELTAGMVNLELTDGTINTNIDRALFLSSDYFTYTDFKTLPITMTTNYGGYVLLSEIDNSGNKTPSIVNVYPITGTTTIEGVVLGLGSFYMKGNAQQLDSYIKSYSNMISKIAELDGILGRGARVVGDKLFVDKYYDKVTVEYVPNIIEVDKIHEGSWIMWIIDYAVALSKRQIAQARGKFVVDSNPFSTNAAQLIEDANAELIRLEEMLENKGVLLTSR